MKFVGIVGFWIGDKETEPGIHKPIIVEKNYVGEVSQNTRRWKDVDQANDQLTVNNSISILSDLFVQQNYSSIKYIVWNNATLKVDSVTLNYPRITLNIGGAYNGETLATTSEA